MNLFSRTAIRHPRLVLCISVATVLLAAPGVLLLHLRTDGHALVPESRAEVARDREIRQRFGADDLIVILIRTDKPDGVFQTRPLRVLQKLTDRLLSLRQFEPYQVTSLATEPGHRVYPGTLNFRPLLDPIPTSDEGLKQLREDVRRIGLFDGTLVSADGSAVSILLGVPSTGSRMPLVGEVQAVVDEWRGGGLRIDVIGPVVAEALLGAHVIEDLGAPPGLLGLTEPTSAGAPAGLPRTLDDLRAYVGRHIGLLPIAIAVMVIVFLLVFRSLLAAALPLLEVGACLVFVFGLMGWTGTPIYLTTAVMPIILAAVGTADEIHVLSRFVQLLRFRKDAPAIAVLAETMGEMAGPIVITSVTTSVGFLSFSLSPLAPVRAFGVFTAIGVVFCMLWSLAAVPAMLVLFGTGRFCRRIRNRRGNGEAGPRVFAGLGGVVTRLRWLVAGATVVGAVLAIVVAFRVQVQDSWISGFGPRSPFRRATESFNSGFLGTHELLLAVSVPSTHLTGRITAKAIRDREIHIPLPDTSADGPVEGGRIWLRTLPGHPGRPREWKAWIDRAVQRDGQLAIHSERRWGLPAYALDVQPEQEFEYEVLFSPFLMPRYIQKADALEAFVTGQSDHTVGGTLGPGQYLRTTHLLAHHLAEDAGIIPEHPDKVLWLWEQYKRIRGENRFARIVTSDFDRTLITAFLKNANYQDVGALMKDIRRYEAENLAPHGMAIEFGGDVAVSQTLIEAIVSTQVRSLLASLVGIVLVASLLCRSLRLGVLSVLPCALAVLANFGVMGWLGIPLGVATSMFAGMTLGIGVDFAIHLLHRYQRARNTGVAPTGAIREALSVTGPAIGIDAVALGLGFGVLVFSQVPANARLGTLLVVSVAGCLIATLAVLPAVLALTSRRAAASASLPATPADGTSPASPVS